MIFIDSGAIYAIFDKNDTNHKCAAAYYKENIKEETFIIECWFLIESRLGAFFSQKFLDAVHSNIFVLREISYVDFENALTINKKYDTAGFGLVDSLSFAFIERNKINKIFTFDRKHFSIYMPDNLKEMTLVPDIY
jgi:predicted nucleic acid-binding protein